MKAHLASRAAGRKEELVVLEIEFTSKARRVRVEANDGLEALDLRGERAGGQYDAAPSLPRLHVPLRVTRDGPGTARVRVTIEDAAGAIASETWDGEVQLEAAAVSAGSARTGLLVAAFAALVGGLVWFVGIPLFQAPKVPALVGRTRADAERSLKALGFAPVTETVAPRTDRDVGIVLGQAPTADTRPPKGSTVVITVGRAKTAPAPGTAGGLAGTVVPELVGHRLAEAEASLGGTGFLLNPVAEDAADELEGWVMRQRPAAGSTAPAGTKIEVIVGRKRAVTLRDVPDVMGLARAEAQAALTEAHLSVLVSEEDADASQVGRVIRQTPAGGSRAPDGSSVGLVVGREKAQPAVAELPHVLGRLRAEAEKALTDAGFVPDVRVVDTKEAPPGTVLSQDPLPGAARKGEKVTIRVVREAEPVPVVPPPPVVPTPPTPPTPPVEPTPPVVPTPVVPTPPTPPVVPPPVEPTPPPVVPTPVVPTPPTPPVVPPPPVEPTPPPVVPPPVVPTPPTPPAEPPLPPVAPAPTVPTPTLVVPDLIGMDRARAEGELRQAGLTSRLTYEDVPEDTPEGFVLRQAPASGDRSADGVVELIVARHAAPAGVLVPDVVGRPEAEAAALLRTAGLGWRVTYQDVSDPSSRGMAVRLDPAGGARVKAGSVVALVVGRSPAAPSAGPSTLPPPRPTVPAPLPPPLPGQPLPPPRRLDAAGATVPPTPPPSSAPPAVPGTAPPRPAPVPPPPTSGPAAPVSVTQGTAVLGVPDFSGRDATEAIEVAIAVGLAPRVVPDRDARAVAGRVRGQDPAPGSPVRTGTPVTLEVGAGSSPAMVDVPNVVGLTAQDAGARLSAAGWTVDLIRVTPPVGVFGRTDQVIAQTPVGLVARDQASVIRLFLPSR